MRSKRSSSIWLTTLVAGGFSLWGCSDTPKPTASDNGDIQGKLTASGGIGMQGAAADTLHPANTMIGSTMGGMHGIASEDSLHTGGMMTDIGTDKMPTAIIQEHHGTTGIDSMMQKHQSTIADDTLHTDGMMGGNHTTTNDTSHTGGMVGMMDSGHTGGVMTSARGGEGATQEGNPSAPQPNPSESPNEGDPHRH